MISETIEDYASIEDDSPESLPDNNRYNIDAYTNAIPVQRLVDDFDKKIITIPEFQRPYVWDKEDRKTARHRPSIFIDSILRGIPIPPITIYKEPKAREEGILVDGQQRIRTLSWFINEKMDDVYKPFELRGEGVHEDWINKNFNKLDKYADVLLRAYIPVTFIRQLSEDTPKLPNASSLYVLFDRLNSGGYPLHPHEKRAVLVTQNTTYSEMSQFISGIYADERWKLILSNFEDTDIAYKETLYKENIFRIFAYALNISGYKGILAKFLDDFMLNFKMSASISSSAIEASKKTLDVLVYIHHELSKDNRSIFKPSVRFNISFYEMFSVALLRRFMQGENIEYNLAYGAYMKILEGAEYYDDGSKTKSDIKSVTNRFKRAEEHFLKEI